MSGAPGRGAGGWGDTVVLAFARLGPAGLSPVMPGTCGSLVAAVTAPLLFLPLGLWWRVALLAVVFVLGALAATRAERALGRQDPGQIVIDELVGQWVVFLPFSTLSWPWLLAGFVLFRVFDMSKPPPIRKAEHWLPGGWGVMLDDVIAGAMALPVLWLAMAAAARF